MRKKHPVPYDIGGNDCLIVVYMRGRNHFNSYNRNTIECPALCPVFPFLSLKITFVTRQIESHTQPIKIKLIHKCGLTLCELWPVLRVSSFPHWVTSVQGLGCRCMASNLRQILFFFIFGQNFLFFFQQETVTMQGCH